MIWKAGILLSLALLLQPVAAAAPQEIEIVSSNTSIPRFGLVSPWEQDSTNYKDYGFKDAIEACRRPYFQLNNETIISSDVITHYTIWSELNRESIQAHSRGEVGYLAESLVGNPNFRCGIGRIGCDALPTCETIVRIYGGDLEMARRVHFSFILLQRVNNYFAVTKSVLAFAYTSATSKGHSAQQIFTQQVDASAHSTCAALKGVIDATVQTTMDFAMQGLGKFAGKLAESAAATAETAVRAVDTAQRAIRDAGVQAANQADTIAQLTKTAQHAQKVARIASKVWPTFSQVRGVATTYFAYLGPIRQHYTGGMCAAFDGEYEIDNRATWSSMLLQLDGLVTRTSNIIVETSETMNAGDYDYEEGSVGSRLAKFLSLGANGYDALESILNNPNKLEAHITRYFVNAVIKMSFSSFPSYVKCTTKDDADEVCSKLGDDVIGRSRACPESGVLCQIQSQTNSKRMREVKVHGLDQFNSSDWNLDVKQVILDSYFRNKAGKSHNIDAHFEFGENAIDDYTKFYLPTCISEGFVTINDFTKHNKVNGDWENIQRFPITCGTWKSERFPEFMSNFDIGANSSHEVDGWRQQQHRTVRQLKANFKYLPAAQFLAECANGIRFPAKKDRLEDRPKGVDHLHPMMNEKSRYCDAIEAELAPFSDVIEANLKFCTDSEIAQRIFREENSECDSLMPYDIYGSKKHGCRKFLKYKLGMDRSDQFKLYPWLKKGKGYARKHALPELSSTADVIKGASPTTLITMPSTAISASATPAPGRTDNVEDDKEELELDLEEDLRDNGNY